MALHDVVEAVDSNPAWPTARVDKGPSRGQARRGRVNDGGGELGGALLDADLPAGEDGHDGGQEEGGHELEAVVVEGVA
ncbi:MAG: hypothetical protein ACRD0A_17720, partial [Acidimicrobiales bacterium]